MLSPDVRSALLRPKVAFSLVGCRTRLVSTAILYPFLAMGCVHGCCRAFVTVGWHKVFCSNHGEPSASLFESRVTQLNPSTQMFAPICPAIAVDVYSVELKASRDTRRRSSFCSTLTTLRSISSPW